MTDFDTRFALPRSTASGYQRRRTFGVRLLLPLLVIVGMRFASDATANASYLALAGYAVLGRPHAVRALVLSWLFTMINPGLAPDASLASIGRYAVMGAAAVSAVLHGGYFRRSRRVVSLTSVTLLLGVFILTHSAAFSYIPDVSMLKAVSWTIAAVSLISCWTGLSPQEHEQMTRQLYWAMVAILLASLPLLVLPTGYLRNGAGFQGLLNHPQAFGTTMGMLGAWTTVRILSERQPPWRLVALAGTCVALVMLSQARTAGLSMVGGVGLSILLAPIVTMTPMLKVAPGLRSGRVWIIFVAAALIGILLTPVIAEITQAYLLKSRANIDNLFELYRDTRGNSLERMLQNIGERPLTGIGFGIASEPEAMIVERDSLLGLPTGAAIEKGLAYLAALEELGVVGATFVAVWLLRLVRSAARGGLAPLTVCLTVLFTNFSESTLFSAGGMGLLWLVLLAWAASVAQFRTT